MPISNWFKSSSFSFSSSPAVPKRLREGWSSIFVPDSIARTKSDEEDEKCRSAHFGL
jgi:hypothetical protein